MKPVINKRFGSNILLGHLGYWAAGIAVAVMGYFLYAAASDAKAATGWVTHTFEVLTDVGRVNELLARAEAAQRGYLLNAEERFLTERDHSISQLGAALARVRKLTADNPSQQARLAKLEILVTQRIELMRENAARRAQSDLVAVAPFNTGRGQQLTTRIYEALEEIRAEERRLLDARRAAESADAQLELGLLIGTIVLALAIVVPGYVGFVIQGRARRAAETRLFDLAHSLPGALYRFRTMPDGTRRFEFLSSGVESLRGVDREAALRDFDAMWQTIAEEDRPLVAARMAQAERTLTPIEYEFRVKSPDGTPRWLRASATLRKDDDGSICWNGYWSDVTHEKALQHALQQARDAADAASRAKSTFLATMSHEIRTPMNGVLGMLELLWLTKLDDEQRSTLQVIRDSGRALLRIIDDILDFSKIEAGKLELRPEIAAVPNVIERVWNMYSGNASAKGLILAREIDSRISPALMVDPLRLQQILNNFVSNAIKFTAKGRVDITARLVDRRDAEEVVEFAVTDTGIGVSASEREKLFKPFAQANAGTAGNYGGTGLGLSICQRLAAMMGGTIGMESQPGVGTRMTLSLPLPVAETKALPVNANTAARGNPAVLLGRRAAPSPEQARREGSLLLLVDDHPINRLVLLKQVNTLGYAAQTAENGLDAFEKWSAGGFAAVITDCNMPEMSGYELATRIREAEARSGQPRSPIIACTANALAGEAENCRASGMDDYLVKPVDLADLGSKMNRWLPLPGAPPAGNESAQSGLTEFARAPDSQPFNPDALAEISAGDTALEHEILAHFRRCNSEDAHLLMNAVEKGDLAETLMAAHRIKGASRTVGAMGLAAVCDRIERASREGDSHAVLWSMDAFRLELGRLEGYIDELKPPAASSQRAAQ